MSGRRRLRLATLLGPNTIDDLHRISAYLTERGRDAAVVALNTDGHDVGVVLAEAEIDLLWACGLLTAELIADGVPIEVVAAPVFSGETAAVYRSVIVARFDDAPLGRRLAVNEFGSWSGYRALFHDASARSDDRWNPDHMDEIVVTGAHVASVAAVADGRADVAAIDHSVWIWLAANDPAAVERLVVVDETVDCPAPPLSLGPALEDEDRDGTTNALLAFGGPPLLVRASIDDYRFMPA